MMTLLLSPGDHELVV